MKNSRTVLVLAMVLVAGLVFVTGVQAALVQGFETQDHTYLGNELFLDHAPVKANDLSAGQYNVYYLGFMAANTNQLLNNGNVIFQNLGDSATSLGTYTRLDVNSSTMFKDTRNNTTVNLLKDGSGNDTGQGTSPGINFFTFTGEPKELGGILFDSSWIFIGFNDGAISQSGGDFNDMVIAVKAVPIPGAAWLFASGLMGLVALRRRQRAA